MKPLTLIYVLLFLTPPLFGLTKKNHVDLDETKLVLKNLPNVDRR